MTKCERNDLEEFWYFGPEQVILKATTNNNSKQLIFWINTEVLLVVVGFKEDLHLNVYVDKIKVFVHTHIFHVTQAQTCKN